MDKDIFFSEIKKVLSDNILDFWLTRMTDPEDGYYGQMDGLGRIVPYAPKGIILNARILWAFSAGWRQLKDDRYLLAATRAKDYILKYFIDKDYGGVYWLLDSDGTVADSKKQFYALAFTIYGLSEYVRCTFDREALDCAIELYRVIEERSRDRLSGGYREAATRDWKELDDMRLSEKDENEKKTMNTHLHILEAYANLYRVWPDEGLRNAISELLDIFSNKIYDNASGHLNLFFDETWVVKDRGISYGHEIEASWLLLDAAYVINDFAAVDRIKEITRIIGLVCLEGIQPDGSMIYEKHTDGTVDNERHWWVQAETVVGALWLWKYHSYADGEEIALNCWRYIKENLIDSVNGEWYWSCYEDGTKNVIDYKAGFWKCPYHNTRMCIQILDVFNV